MDMMTDSGKISVHYCVSLFTEAKVAILTDCERYKWSKSCLQMSVFVTAAVYQLVCIQVDSYSNSCVWHKSNWHIVTWCCWCAVRKWFKVEVISTVSEPVRDVAFSPNLGRSYHMLAVASKDVHIFSLKPLTRYWTCNLLASSICMLCLKFTLRMFSCTLHVCKVIEIHFVHF